MTATNATLSGRVLIAAFEGWSDAGGAASAAAQWMLNHLNHEIIAELSAEEYVDYQMHRPRLTLESDGSRSISWPDTRLYGPVVRPASQAEDDGAATIGSIDGEVIRYVSGALANDVFILLGAEPSRNWQQYVQTVIKLCTTWEIDHVIVLGSLFADTPHSRPISTIATSENPELRARFNLERSEYEGPAGIASIFAIEANAARFDQISVWASVPHYVHSAPSPKATLALLDQLEELLDIVIPRGELVEQSNDWEANITSLAAGDRDMAEYIAQLEQARDEVEGPEATGEAIAHEFEKFLRRDSGRSAESDAD